jgi:hypothetical protein
MAMTFEEMLKANLAGRANVDVPAIGTLALKGMESADNIKSTILKRKKEEFDLKKEIEQALAQKHFVEAAKMPLQQAPQRPSGPDPRIKPLTSQVPQATPETTTSPINLDDMRVGGIEPAFGSGTVADQLRAQYDIKDLPKMEEEAKKREEANRAIQARNAAVGLVPEELAKSFFKSPTNSSGNVQQTQFSVTDPTTGRTKTVKGVIKSLPGGGIGIFNPLTDQQVKDPNDLPEAGYRQGANIEGRDPKTNLPVEYNPQTNVYTSGGKVWGGGVLFPNLQNAPASFSEAVASYSQAKNTLSLITDSYKEQFVGPLAGRFNSVEQWLGTNDPETGRFMSLVGTFNNAMIKAITGAQMSEPEAVRILGPLPTVKDNPALFLTKLQVAAEAADLAMKSRLEAAQASGFAVQPYAMTEQSVTALLESKLGLSPKSDRSKPGIVTGVSKSAPRKIGRFTVTKE